MSIANCRGHQKMQEEGEPSLSGLQGWYSFSEFVGFAVSSLSADCQEMV
jgi:hypothetical protein